MLRGIGSLSTRVRPRSRTLVARSILVRMLLADEKRQSGTLTGRPSSSGQRALAEVLRVHVRQVADRERVAHARRDVEHAHLVRRVRGGDEARVGHEVDGDDVDPDAAVGAEAAGDDAGAVAEHDRVGDLQRLHPARVRRVQRGLDDRRADDRELLRVRAEERALAEGLGQAVRVAPAEGARAFAAALGELLAHPLVAQDLGAGADGRAAGGADRAVRFGDEPVLMLRQARLGLDVVAPGLRGVQLGVEVQPGLGRRGARRLLEHEPGAHARGVGRGHVDEVRVAAGVAHGLQQARRSLRVQLQRLVERLLEGDGRGAVDDDVDPAADVQALTAEVAADGLHAAAVQSLARTAVEDLVLEALLRVAAQQQRDLRVRQLPQDLAEHGFSEESRGPGEQDGLAGQLLLDEDVVRQSEHRTSRLY